MKYLISSLVFFLLFSCKGKQEVNIENQTLGSEPTDPNVEDEVEETSGTVELPTSAPNQTPTSNSQIPTQPATLFALGQYSSNSVEGRIKGLADPEGVFTDGSKLIIADTDNHRVLIWNQIPTSSADTPDLVLGQPNLSSNIPNNGGISASSLQEPTHAFTDGTRLYVADSTNNRVLIWNTFPTVSGEAADVVLGQQNFTSNAANQGGVSGSSFDDPKSVYSNGTALFVADDNNNRILVWNSIPTVSGSSANFALGQTNLTSNTANSGGLSASSLDDPSGISSDGNILLVADDGNHRVLLWSSLPTSFAEPANIALGQPNLVSNGSNQGGISAASLNRPCSVHTDGTRIIVSDTLNNRVLVWNNLPITSAESADLVLGQPNFTSAPDNNGGLSASSIY